MLKFLGHLTPEEMSRVDDAVRASLALNPMGSIQRLPPIIRSTAAYAPPEVVNGKPPLLFLGHADTEMTEHYLHVQESIRQSAIQLFSEAFSA